MENLWIIFQNSSWNVYTEPMKYISEAGVLENNITLLYEWENSSKHHVDKTLFYWQLLTKYWFLSDWKQLF